MSHDTPDPRVEKEGICGVTFTGSTGIEWVCVKDTHQKIYPDKRYGFRLQDNPSVHRHYFVNKWPHRPTNSGVEEGFFDDA